MTQGFIDIAIQEAVIKTSMASGLLAQHGRFVSAFLGTAIANIGILFLKVKNKNFKISNS